MKILIIGIVASGKTTLAKRLSRELNIMHYEIDRVIEQLDKYSSQLIRVNKIKYGEKYIKNEVTILIKRGNIWKSFWNG